MGKDATHREFVVRDHRAPGHFWADNELLDIFGPRLGPHGIAVYMVMARRADNDTGKCKLSTRRIAELVGMSKGGVFNALNLICALGLGRLEVAGTNTTPGTYVLASIKSLVRSPDERGVHGVNAAFTGKTPHKDVNTSLNTSPLTQRGARTASLDGSRSKTGKCKLHPHSGKTEWGSCWACHELQYSTEPPEDSPCDDSTPSC